VLLHCPSRAHTWKAGPRIPAVQRFGSPVPPQLLLLWVARRQQENLRAPTTCRLGFPMPAATAVASGSPCPNTRPQSHCCLADTRRFKLPSLLSLGYPQLATQCQSLPPYTQVKLRPQALLFFGARQFPSPQNIRAFPTVPDSKRDLTSPPKHKNSY
jgi:hypothetical protein